MPGSAKDGGIVAFIIIGMGMVVIGITSEVSGLIFGGLTFIIIGAASVLRARKREEDKED